MTNQLQNEIILILVVENAKLTELENKIPDVSGLARKTALTAVEN